MSKIISIFWIILTIVNITHAQYVSADTMRIQPLLFQADTFFQEGKHDAAFAKADTVRRIIAQIFDQNGIATPAIVHLKVKAIYFQQGKDKEQQAIHQIESLLKQPLPKFYIKDSIEQAKDYWFLAKLYYQLNDYNKVLTNASKSHQWIPETFDTIHTSKIKDICFKLAKLYWDVGATDKANHLIKQATNLVFSLPESQQTVSDFINIGDFFSKTGQNHKTMQYYQQALLLYYQKKDSAIPLFAIYKRLGLAHHHLSQWETALQYYQKGLELTENTVESFGFLANMSEVYRYKGLYDKNLDYIKRSMAVLKRFEPDEYPLGSYMRLGLYYTVTQQFTLAEEVYQKVLDFKDQEPYHKVMALENLVMVKMKQNDYKTADSLLQVALKWLNFDKGLEKNGSLIRLKYTLLAKAAVERALFKQNKEIRYLTQSRQSLVRKATKNAIQ